MAESKADQIVDAVVKKLASIQSDGGETYWHSPDRVRRVRTWKEAHFDPTLRHLIFIRPGQERHFEDGTGGRMRGELYLFIVTARQHKLSDPDGDSINPGPWTLAERSKRDILKAILQWRTEPTIPYVYNVMGEEEGLLAEHVDDALLPGWAILELTIKALYTYNKVTP